MTPENLKKVKEVIQIVFDKKESRDFHQPVLFKELGLTDYPLIIKKPMDLGTILKNLDEGFYKKASLAFDDLQLVWDNCKLYNMEYSKIYKISGILECFSRKKINEAFPGIKYGKNNPAFYSLEDMKQRNYYEEEITHNQKIEFSNKIRELKEDQIAEVVKILKENCTRAYKVTDKINSEILVDNITKEVYKMILNYFEEIKFKRKSKSN